MWLNKVFRITGLSARKGGVFLNSTPPVFTLIHDINNFDSFFMVIRAEAWFKDTCEKRLTEHTRLLLEGLTAEYNYTMTEAT